jgi:hypothetical protein
MMAHFEKKEYQILAIKTCFAKKHVWVCFDFLLSKSAGGYKSSNT